MAVGIIVLTSRSANLEIHDPERCSSSYPARVIDSERVRVSLQIDVRDGCLPLGSPQWVRENVWVGVKSICVCVCGVSFFVRACGEVGSVADRSCLSFDR